MRMLPLCIALAVSSAVVLPSALAQATKRASAPSAPAACSDFYGHINTPWLRAQPLPPGMDAVSRWSEMRGIAEHKALAWMDGNVPSTISGRALGLLQQSASSDDNESLKPYLSRIAGIKKNRDLGAQLASLHAQGMPWLVERDAAGTYGEGGGILGSAAAYRNLDTARSAAYVKYVESLSEAAGVASATANALLSFEKSLLGRVPTDAVTQSRKDANKRHPNLKLGDYAGALGDRNGDLRLSSATYFATLDERIAKQSLTQWQDFLRIWVAHQHAEGLSAKTRRARAELNAALRGERAIADDANLRASSLERAAAPLWNAAYAEQLSADQQNYIRQLADTVRAAASRRVQAATWLDAAQRQAIESRLKALGLQIGATADMRGLDLKPNAFAHNLAALRRWRAAQDTDSLTWLEAQSQPILAFDRKGNRILISTALAQTPVLFNANVPGDYGAFGALYAQQLAQIILDESESAFRARGDKLVSQYNAYTAVGTRKVNGSNTQRQNLADLMALEIALDALHQKTNARDADKAFFAGWASMWARQDRDAALSAKLASMSYAPAKWRVNGPLANLPSFALAYGCKAGTMQRAAKDQTALLR